LDAIWHIADSRQWQCSLCFVFVFPQCHGGHLAGSGRERGGTMEDLKKAPRADAMAWVSDSLWWICRLEGRIQLRPDQKMRGRKEGLPMRVWVSRTRPSTGSAHRAEPMANGSG
jgi:hypothetical protein